MKVVAATYPVCVVVLLPGRPLLLDSNAIVCLDLLPLSHVSGGTAGPTALAAAAALQGAAASSLFGLLDRTASAAGKRKLKQWICRCGVVWS